MLHDFNQLMTVISRHNQVVAQLTANYQKTHALLVALKGGSITLDRVDVSEDGWSLLAVNVEEPEPAPAAPEPVSAAA